MDVHYRDEGIGQVIVLLHGTGASLHTWDKWTKELKKKYRVIRLDLPAYGVETHVFNCHLYNNII